MTLLLTRTDIAGLMTPGDYLAAVERAFRLSRARRAPSPPPMHVAGNGGGFHAKGAALQGARPLAALKLNANFPGNPARGLPTIQGVILLCDGDTGALLAVMDSIEITLRRTAAASALAAKHLARADSEALAIVGCGAQALPQAQALCAVLPLKRAFVWDIDAAKATACATEATRLLGIPVVATSSLRAATRDADVIVTCTTARSPILDISDVRPGAFIAAIGADNPEKSEIAPTLMARALVVADVLEQCLTMGDLHHAIKAGTMGEEDIHAELADIVTASRPGRSRCDDIIIFDSTGTAIQDVASAALVYERAIEHGIGQDVKFS